MVKWEKGVLADFTANHIRTAHNLSALVKGGKPDCINRQPSMNLECGDRLAFRPTIGFYFIFRADCLWKVARAEGVQGLYKGK